MRILIVRFKSLGDIFLSLPLALELAQRISKARVEVVVDEQYGGLPERYDFLERVWSRPSAWFARGALARVLRGGFDLAIDLQGTPASAVFARLAARKVLGFPGKRFSFLYDWTSPAMSEDTHTIEGNLAFLRYFGEEPPEGRIPPVASDERYEKELRERFGGEFTLIHPGGRFAHKRYPRERFRRIAEWLREKGRRPVVLLGPDEAGDVSCWSHYDRLEDVSPDRLGPLMRAASLFIGNDSGPAHIAAAAGIPTVVIFGPTNRFRWSPRGNAVRVVSALCRCPPGWAKPCLHPEQWCLGRLPVEEVLRAVEDLGRKKL